MFSRTSRILLVAAVLAFIAYRLVDRASHRTPDQSGARLAAFDAGRVDHLIVEREDGTIRFAREDSLWRMTEPVDDMAEPATVISLLDALEHADIARNLGATDDLAPFGLDPPELRITLRSGADTLLAAALGKRTVDDAWTYALSPARDLVLVPTDISRAATLPVDAYRNQRVLDFRVRDIGRFELRAPDHSTAWMRRAGRWLAVESGDTIAGDSVAVESVLRRLRGLRVAGFLDSDTSSVGPVTTLTLWGTGGNRFAVVRFARPKDRWLAHVDHYRRTVVVADDVGDLLAHTTNELRDRRLLQFSPAAAMRIVFQHPSVSGELVRTGGSWSFPNPALGRVDPEHAADFVRALRALKWDAPAPSGSSTGPPWGVLIFDAGGAILDELTIRPREGQAAWLVSSRSSGSERSIDPARLDHLAGLFKRVRNP